MRKLLIIISLILGTSLLQASETVEGAKKDYAQFKQEMRAELDAAEAKIVELKGKAKEKGSEAQDRTIQELEQTRDELSAKLEKMQDNGETGWKKFKKNFANSVDNLNKKIQKSLSN